MSTPTGYNGAAGPKPAKKGGPGKIDPNAERYARLTKATVFIPAPIFNFTDFPDIYFEAQILGKDNDPKNKGCMVVKFTNYKDRYFFPLNALEDWVDKYHDVPRNQVRDFSTWGPEVEKNLQAGMPMPAMPPSDSKQTSSTGGGRKRKHDGIGGKALGRAGSLSALDLVNRDVAIPAPMLHKAGSEVYKGRVMAVHLTIPDDLLIMLYDDPAGVFQLGASEVARLLVPDTPTNHPAKKQQAASGGYGGQGVTSKPPGAGTPKPAAAKVTSPSGAAAAGVAGLDLGMEGSADHAAGGGSGAKPEPNNDAAAAPAPQPPGDVAMGEAGPMGGEGGGDISSKVKEGTAPAAAAAAAPGGGAQDTLGVARRDQNLMEAA